MIEALRRKFIVTAMLSLGILLVFLIGGVALLGYYQTEKTADALLETLCSETPPTGAKQPLPFATFGYQIRPEKAPAGHFEALVTAQGQIVSLHYRGMLELQQQEAQQYIQAALAKGAAKGKIGSYKYALVAAQNQATRLVFLDVFLQMQTLRTTIVAALVVGLGCMVLMLGIVCLVSGRVIAPLAQNIEKQQRFVSDAGHEIKTPLGIIMANTDAMELHLGENKWSKNIRSQTQRMNELMNGLLLLARMDEGAGLTAQETVDLSAVLRRAVADFHQPAKNKQLRLQASIASGVVVQGVAHTLGQLASILLDNAVKYTNPGGDIAVTLTTQAKRVVLWVENSTDALPTVAPATLFDRFYRASSARTQREGGYGIGLSAAQAIVQAHGGRIEASYKDSQRIRFTVRL